MVKKELAMIDQKEREEYLNMMSKWLFDFEPAIAILVSNYVYGAGPKVKEWTPRTRYGFTMGLEYVIPSE